MEPAAEAVLQDLLGCTPPGMVMRLSEWLRVHAVPAARRQRRHWQWDLTLSTWMLEQAGAPARACGEQQGFDDLLAAAGIDAVARRQGPFVQWRRGEMACTPGFAVAGADTGDQAVAARRGRASGRLLPATMALLDELAVRYGGAAAGPREPREDVAMTGPAELAAVATRSAAEAAQAPPLPPPAAPPERAAPPGLLLARGGRRPGGRRDGGNASRGWPGQLRPPPAS